MTVFRDVMLEWTKQDAIPRCCVDDLADFAIHDPPSRVCHSLIFHLRPTLRLSRRVAFLIGSFGLARSALLCSVRPGASSLLPPAASAQMGAMVGAFGRVV